MRLIGINGFKRSGKGETGLAIEALLNDRFITTTLVGFADKLKILGARTLGFVDLADEDCITLMDECKEEWVINIVKRIEVSYGYDLPPSVEPRTWHTLTGREYLQNLGTEARKVFGEDFWVDQVLPRVPRQVPHGTVDQLIPILLQNKYPGTDAVVITDLRFENEAQRVIDLGGEVWEVIRPGLTSDGHASEIPLTRSLVTRQIHNSSDLMNLRFQVEKALGL